VLRPAAALPACLAALLAAGCGAERREPPDPARPFATAAPAERAFPSAGVRFEAPADLRFEPGPPPLVASASTGTATVAIWRYPRTEPLPRDDAALDDARKALEGAARTRDGSFDLDRSRRVRIDGAPGVELLGAERVAGRDRRVRSTHLYARGAEVVIDAYAAPQDFAAVDRQLIRPLLRSLQLDRPRA
jgi:hypothetical protein